VLFVLLLPHKYNKLAAEEKNKTNPVWGSGVLKIVMKDGVRS
jgi:hypothetical protein